MQNSPVHANGLLQGTVCEENTYMIDRVSESCSPERAVVITDILRGLTDEHNLSSLKSCVIAAGYRYNPRACKKSASRCLHCVHTRQVWRRKTFSPLSHVQE